MTNVAARNNTRLGWVKGEHVRYVLGHHARQKSPSTIAKASAAMSGENNPMFGKRGPDHPWFGGRHTDAARARMSEAKLGANNPNYGKKSTGEIRERRRDAQSGERNPNWRGGINPPNERARRTDEYIAWRQAVLARDKWTCRKCDRHGGDLNAHHIKPFAAHPELRTEIDNGLTLCGPCHRAEHRGKEAATT